MDTFGLKYIISVNEDYKNTKTSLSCLWLSALKGIGWSCGKKRCHNLIKGKYWGLFPVEGWFGATIASIYGNIDDAWWDWFKINYKNTDVFLMVSGQQLKMHLEL